MKSEQLRVGKAHTQNIFGHRRSLSESFHSSFLTFTFVNKNQSPCTLYSESRVIFLIKRRKVIRIVCYLLAVCVVIGVSGVFSGRAKASYEETLGRVRFEALNSLCEYVFELGSGLSILSVSQDDAVEDSAAYVASRALGAMACVGCFNSKKNVNIGRFLESAYGLSQEFSGSEQSREYAAALSDYAEELYYHLSDVASAVMGGKYSLVEYGSVYSANEKPCFEDYLDYSNGREDELFGGTKSASANGRYEILSGEETVSVVFAKEKASGIIGIDEVLWRESDSAEGVYSLFHGDCKVEITKSGGRLIKIINPLPCAERVYTLGDAELKAKRFIENQGIESTEIIGNRLNDFTADFRFVPSVNGVLLLTAPIDISVCLSSGEITFFDASDYIRNRRSDVYASSSVPDLGEFLSEKLEPKKNAVCIADINGRERLCYLAICGFEDGELWVYIDYADLHVLKMQKISLRI